MVRGESRAFGVWMVGLAAAVSIGATIASGCSPAGPHLVRHTVAAGGRTRIWYQYRPPGLPAGPAPVLVVLHGYGNRPADILSVTGLADEARRDGFVLVLPQGVAGSWDAGDCCAASARRGTDDVGFLAGLLDRLNSNGTAVPGHLYLAGFSNGAMMALEVACTHPDPLGGVAMIEGTMTSPCPAHRPLDLLVIHQTGDDIVPYLGAPNGVPGLATKPLVSVPSAISQWLSAIACTTVPVTTPASPATGVTSDAYPCPGGTRTVVDIVRGGGHRWPGGSADPLDATGTLARFFALRH